MPQLFYAADKPWFKHAIDSSFRPQSALIIGAGLAGTQTAYALANIGIASTIVEKKAAIAAAASGNRAGVIYSKFSPHDSAQIEFYEASYRHAIAHLARVLPAPDGVNWDNCGVLQLAFDHKTRQLQQKLLAANKHFGSTIKAVSASEATKIANLKIDQAGLFFADAGWVYPKFLCQKLLQASEARLLLNHCADSFKYLKAKKQWQLNCINASAGNKVSLTADVLVIANAHAALKFACCKDLPLKTIRGQVSVASTSGQIDFPKLKTVISHSGYICPPINQRLYFGASFNLHYKNTSPSLAERKLNLVAIKNNLGALYPSLERALSQQPLNDDRVGLRSQSTDYLPLIGPVAKRAKFKQDYANINARQRFVAGSYYPNLYLNIAHGSRGIVQTGYGAQIIAAYISNNLHQYSPRLLHGVHPARFLIRNIIRKR